MHRSAPAAVVAASLLLTGCAAVAPAPAGPARADTAVPAPPQQSVVRPPVPQGPDPADIVRVPQPVFGAAPVAAQVPGLGPVPIVPAGVAPDGQAEIPQDVSQVGWYRYGSAPGDGDGSVVLMGHRDGRGARGALYDLAAVPIGSVITVTDADGVQHDYRVTANDSISKEVVPLADLFVRDGPAQLVLISCGGAYIKERGGYLDNVVVTAVKL